MAFGGASAHLKSFGESPSSSRKMVGLEGREREYDKSRGGPMDWVPRKLYAF